MIVYPPTKPCRIENILPKVETWRPFSDYAEAVERELHRALRILGVPTDEHQARITREGRVEIGGGVTTYFLGAEPLVCVRVTFGEPPSVTNLVADGLAAKHKAPVAQTAEQRLRNPQAGGSTPPGGSLRVEIRQSPDFTAEEKRFVDKWNAMMKPIVRSR